MFIAVMKEGLNDNLDEGNVQVKTRSSRYKKIIISRPRYEWFRKSVVYQGKKRWLDLPSYLKEADGIDDFSKKIKLYYFKEFKETGVIR